MKAKLVVLALVMIAGLAAFFLAPVIYAPIVVEPYNQFAGYESTSCLLVGLGTSYVVGFSYHFGCFRSNVR